MRPLGCLASVASFVAGYVLMLAPLGRQGGGDTVRVAMLFVGVLALSFASCAVFKAVERIAERREP